MLSSLIFVIYFVISLFTSTNNSSKHSWVTLSFILFLKIHVKTSLLESKLQVSRPETSLKRDSGSGIFLWILRNFSKTIFTEHLRLTALADSSFLTKVLSTDHTLFAFSFIFFLLLFIIAVTGVYSEKSRNADVFNFCNSLFKNQHECC